MELKFNATIDITGGDLRAIVTAAVEAQMQGYTVTKVNFEVGNETRGYGMGEYNEPVFRGVKVSVEPKKSVKELHDGRGPG